MPSLYFKTNRNYDSMKPFPQVNSKQKLLTPMLIWSGASRWITKFTPL